MLFYEQPTDPWLPFDFKLLEAYQILQDEICPKCNHPIWLCRSTDPRVQFKVTKNTCYAERALREYEDHKKPRGEKKAERKERENWGVFLTLSPFTPDNVEGELPTRSEFYATLFPDNSSDTVN